MKKLYALLSAALIVAGTASAAVPASLLATKSLKRNAAPAQTVQFAQPAKSDLNIKLVDAVAEAKQHPVTRKAPAKAPAETADWTSIGTGTYREDLLTYYDDVAELLAEEGNTWAVDIEECDGWYRFRPYVSEDCPIVQLIGYADEECYIYIDANDPEKVAADYFIPYGLIIFANYVPGVFVETADGYGTMKNGVISWASSSLKTTWTYTTNGQNFYLCSYQTEGVALALPGSYMPNFSLTAEAPLVTTTNDVDLILHTGYSFKRFYYAALKGDYDVTDEGNAEVIIEYGEEMENGNTPCISLPLEDGNGLYTFMLVGVDADGTVMGALNIHILLRNPEGEDWASAGETSFTENIYFTDYGLGEDFDTQTYTLAVESDLNHPGHIRLVDAFTSCPIFMQYGFVTDAPGDYNLYINILDNDHVILEASATGIDLAYGEGLVWSYPGLFLSDDTDEDYDKYYAWLEQEGFFGSIAEDGVLTIPAGSILLSETKWNDGAFVDSDGDIQFQLPEEVLGVKSAIIAPADGAEQFYNLQGVRVDSPVKGGLYILTQGGKASKVVF